MPTGWLLAAWLVLPLLFTATLLALVATDITFLNAASRTPGAAPAYVLAAAGGLVALRRRWLQAAAAACLLVGIAAATVNYFNGVQFLNPIYALPTRALAAELAAQAQPGDLILGERDTLIGYYYSLHPGRGHVSGCRSRRRTWPGSSSTTPSHIWLVTFGRDSTEGAFGTPELRATLAASYTPGASTRLWAGGAAVPGDQAAPDRAPGLCRQADDPTVHPLIGKGSHARTLSLQGLLSCPGRHREPHPRAGRGAAGARGGHARAGHQHDRADGRGDDRRRAGRQDGAPGQRVVGAGEPALLLLGAQAGSGCRHRPCAHAVSAGRGGAPAGRARPALCRHLSQRHRAPARAGRALPALSCGRCCGRRG